MPVYDAGVIQFIGNDGVFCFHQSLEETSVGIEAGTIENGVFSSEELAQLALQLLVNRLGATNEAHTSKSISPAI
jgi:hypothetical protein